MANIRSCMEHGTETGEGIDSMNGKLYGVGVGPGDPELLTLKAKRIIEESDVLIVPVKSEGEKSTAFEIIRPVVDLEGKDIRRVVFTMDADSSVYWECGKNAGDLITNELRAGKDVAVITLGDVSIYSTYSYINRFVIDEGFETCIIPGVPSFCGGAALAGIPLVLGEECLTIVPSVGNRERVEKAIGGSDNVVIMKAGGSIGMIADIMRLNGIPDDCATVISNVGMAKEYIGPLDCTRRYGYFTTVILKKKRPE